MNRYDLKVGTAAHQTVAAVARLGRGTDPATLTRTAWQEAGKSLEDAKDLGMRLRAARLVVASSAAVYARIFLPPPSWTLVGTEVPIDGGRIDLVWETDDGLILYDEVKLGGSQDLPIGVGKTSRQIHRYADHGSNAYGERFAGVRLCLLGAPRRSLLLAPGNLVRFLILTNLWFEDTAQAFQTFDEVAA